jgi:predicted nucleic acid-binding protein
VSRALADTSIFIARESGRLLRSADLPAELAVSIITVAELRAGVLAAADVTVRDLRLATLTVAQAFDPLPVDGAVAVAWARLHVLLRDAGRRMPVNDSWIAATALAAGLPVLTQDDDYDAATGLGGLAVLKV